jgi:predicted ribosomally synthesized peptide with SipW-like signal peptide
MSDQTFELSRRKVLAGAGAIGVAGAGAGLGTTAFFSDGESFTNNQLVAGSLDLKAAYSVHYSDWSPDDDGSDTATSDDDVDVRMWEGPPGTPGGPGDLAGDEAGLPIDRSWLIAVDDPEQFLENTETASEGRAVCGLEGTDAEDLEQPVIELDDVKPGDFGEVTFDLALCDNPGYIWLQVDDAIAFENGYSEPEAEDEDESGSLPVEGFRMDPRVELLDAVQAAYWVDDGNNYLNDDETVVSRGSLRHVLGELSGIGAALPGDLSAEEGGGTGEQGCFSAGQHSIGFAWWLPVDHANEIQTDSVEFSLTFYTEQCRHNVGTGDRLAAFVNDDAPLNEQPWDGSIVDRTGDPEVVVKNNALTQVNFPDEPLFGPPPQELPMAFDPQVVRVSPGTTVTWEWQTYSDPLPDVFNRIPHNVVAVDGSFNSGRPVPAATASDFSHTFTDAGIHLYYCDPHGGPHFHPSSPGIPFQEVINESGMRGAVIVEG